jgi:phosphate:Na+ symporter
MYIQILKLCAGIGLFLFAMYLIEESLKNLSGRNFKLFLQRVTKNRFGAVAGGAVVTGVLQSSSMVSLMVLAFVGAGVFTMKNALAIILGANLGTTLDSWIVATLGFKTNIEVIAYPSVFIGGALLILFGKRKSIKYLSFFLFGFGLLFIGLSFMKTAMAAQLQFFDFSAYSNMPLAIFLLIGFLITLLVQSSSVTMALTLSAIHVGAINFPSAAAIVLGSETGTTMKLLLSGIGGTAAKKRVVLGNLLFNIFLTLFAFTFMRQIVLLITTVFTITDPLIGLVTFSSLVNLMSILLFLPFLEPFTRFLEKFFKNVDASIAAFIGNANVSEPQTALDLFKREATYFIHNSMLLNLELMEINSQFLQDNPILNEINERKKFMQKSAEEKYEFLKLLQGELQAFYLILRPKLQDEGLTELNGLVSAVRHSIYAAKSMKDNRRNIGNLRRSSKNIKFSFLSQLKTQTEALYHFFHFYNMSAEHTDLQELQQAYKDIENNYNGALNDFYKDPQTTQLDDLDLTTIINFNRELLSSNRAMLLAVKDFLLNEKQSIAFNETQTI